MLNRKQRNLLTKNYKIEDANILNDLTFVDYLMRLERLARSLFEWKLPRSMNAQFLEKTLYFMGEGTMFKHKDFGYINTKCSRQGGLNIYDYPTSLHCYSHDLSEDRSLYVGLINDETVEDNECILVQNNWDSIPTYDTIFLFARRLANCDRVSDVNLDRQRTPWIILVDEKQRLTVENMINQVNSNNTNVVGNKGNLNPDTFKSIDIRAPFVIDKIQEYKRQIWNELLTFFGINNLADEKKERMIESEINSNNEIINLNLQSFFAPRQEACNLFNEKFGLKGENAISVKLRSDLHNIIKETESVIVGKKPEEKEKSEVLENE